MPRALVVEIFGDAKQFAAELDKAAGKTRAFGKAAGVAGAVIAGGLAVGLEKSVKAAAGAQVSTARMNEAFKQSGVSATRYAGQIDKVEAAGRNLGFMNTELKESLGSLEVATHDPAKAMQDLGTAENVARFKHIGLVDATKLVTSAMAGSTRAARQLGLSMQPIKTEEDKVSAAFKVHSGAAYKAAEASAKFADKQKTSAAIVALLNEKLAGQAQAFAGTLTGKMKVYQAQMESLQENIGAGLLPILSKLAGLLADATGWLSKHTDVAKIAVGVLAGLAVTLGLVSVATKLYAAGQVIAAAASKAFAAGQWLLNVALEANPIGIVVVALAALGGALYLAWTKSQTFRNIVEGAWHGIQAAAQTVVNFFTSTVPNAFDTVRHAAVTAFNALKGIWDGLKGAWSAAWHGLENIVLGPIDSIISKIQDLIGWIQKIPTIHTPSGGPASSGGTRPGQPRGPIGGRGAAGAIVRSPTFALIGEAGPEALIPLNRMPGASPLGGGRQAPVSVTVNVSGWVGDNQALANKIRNELVALGRREGSILAGYA